MDESLKEKALPDLMAEVEGLTYKQVRYFKMSFGHTARLVIKRFITEEVIVLYATGCVKETLEFADSPSGSDRAMLKRVRLQPEIEENSIKAALMESGRGRNDLVAGLFRGYQIQ